MMIKHKRNLLLKIIRTESSIESYWKVDILISKSGLATICFL